MQTISFQSSTWFPKLFKDYIAGKKELEEFYAYRPTLEGLQEALAKREFPQENREILVEVLLEQYKGIPKFKGSLVEKNVLSLRNPTCFTLTTGQQLHPFLGPEMVFNKIQAVIDSSISLSAVSADKPVNEQREVIPVFWMASEDHDFEEVQTIRFFGKDFVWDKEQDGAVGSMPTNSLVKTIQNIIDAFSHDEKVVKLLTEYKEIYARHTSFANATREVAFKLFGEEGLVSIDADNTRLKELFLPQIEKEVQANFAFSELKKSNDSLNSLGYKTVLNPQKENFFLLEEGNRQKMNNEAAGSLSSSPKSISPNVVLRPVYQEVILPNIGYFAGPSELSYWLQLKQVFTSLGVPYPVLLPRMFTLGIKQKDLQFIAKNDFKLESFFKDEPSFITLVLKKESAVMHSLLLEKESVLKKMEEESKKLGAIFYKSIKNTFTEEAQNLRKVRKELELAGGNQDKINKLLRIKKNYFETPQERILFGVEKEVNDRRGLSNFGTYFRDGLNESILLVEV